MNNEKESIGVSMMKEEKPTMNAFQRLFGIFFSPNQTFQDIAKKPSFVLPLIIMIIFSLIATVIIMPKIDIEAAILENIEKSGREISDAEMESAMAWGEKIGNVSGYIGAVAGPIIITLIVAVIYFGIIRLWRAGSTFSKVFSVTVHSFFVGIIKTILAIIVAPRLEDRSLLAQDAQNLVKSNLSVLLNREEVAAPLYIVASKIDIFSIWIMVLAILGLAAVSKLNIKQSAAIVLILWLIFLAANAIFFGIVT